MKKEEKKAKATDLVKVYVEELRKLHPRLPAYFCGYNGVIVPIPSGEDAEQKMAELGLVRLDPDGHIDTDVLWSLYELMAEEHDDLLRQSWCPQVAFNILRKALANKNSKLSQTIAKAYGQE